MRGKILPLENSAGEILKRNAELLDSRNDEESSDCHKYLAT